MFVLAFSLGTISQLQWREVDLKQRSCRPEQKRQKSIFGAGEAAGICRSGYRIGGSSTTEVEGGRSFYTGIPLESLAKEGWAVDCMCTE